MPSRVRILLLTLSLISLQSTICAADGSPADLDFADPPLGGDWERIPQDAVRGPNCLVQANYVDCEFAGSDGVQYLVFGQDVIRKEIRQADAQGKSSIPFKLHFGDSAAQVRHRIESAYAIKLSYTALPADRAYAAMLYTGLFLKNKLGVAFGVYFLFDRSDRLTVVGVTVGEPG